LSVNLFVLACVGVCVLLGLRWATNVYQGPLQLDVPALSQTSMTFASRNYGKVDGETSISTGVTQTTTTTRNGHVESASVTAEFMALKLGSRLLVVKAHPGTPATHYVGTLTSLPEDVKARVFDGLDADLRSAFLPTMLDASNDYEEGIIPAVGGLAIVVVVVSWNLVRWKRRSNDFSQHPFAKNLARYGPLEAIVPQIDAEVMAGAGNFGSTLFVTKSWFLDCGHNSAMRKDQILWAYKKQTKTSVNGIPTGTTFNSIIRDSWGGSIEISGSEQQVHGLLTGMVETMPWIIVGYTPELEKMFKRSRQNFAQAVAERRQEFAKAMAAAKL
jgi:hypothetical protein